MNYHENQNQNNNKNKKSKKNIYLYIIIGLVVLNMILLVLTAKPNLTLEQQVGQLYNDNQNTWQQIQRLKAILNGGHLK